MQYVVRRPKVEMDCGDEKPLIEAKTIYDSDPADIGLVSPTGLPIYRIRGPIGFFASRQAEGAI